MFNCKQAVEITCCTAGKGAREGEKASMHVKASPGMLHIVGCLLFCRSENHLNIEFTYAGLGFFEGICLFPFFKNNQSSVIEKKTLSISLY